MKKSEISSPPANVPDPTKVPDPIVVEPPVNIKELDNQKVSGNDPCITTSDQHDKQENDPQDRQNQDVSMPIDQDPHTMEEEEYTPIVISKPDTWKANCVIQEAPQSSRFCNYIIKIVKERVDVTAIINEKKFNKETSQKNHVISVKVGSEKDLNVLLALEFNLPATTEGMPSTRYIFTKMRNLLKERKATFKARENRTIKVFNISLYMENSSIKAVFSRYGELEEDSITTCLKGIYRQALVTYKEEQSIEVFYSQWSVWAFKECLSVVPCLLSEDKRDE